MKVQDLCLSKLNQDLLFENGVMDRRAGIALNEGWQQVCDSVGYTPHVRSPAREKYADGWHSVKS